MNVSESKIDRRQLKTLLRAAWKTDLRGSNNPMDSSGSKSTKFPPLLGVLIMKGVIGIFMGVFTLVVGDPFLTAFVVYSTLLVFLAITVLLEFSNLILSPDEYQIIATRPIGSKTFFAAKLIHLLAYVNILGAVIYAPSTVTIAIATGNILTFFTFFLGGLLFSSTIGLLFVLLYTIMLRIVNRETMQRVLGYSQLFLIIIIYFGFFVVPRLFGTEAIASLQGIDVTWFYLAPPAWFAAIAGLPSGSGPNFIAAALALVLMYISYRAAVSKLSLGYAQTLSNTVAQQDQAQAQRKRGILANFITLISSHEDRAVWSLIRKQFKYDNRFKMSVLTILPLTALYVYMGIADGDQIVNPFRIMDSAEDQGMNILIYLAVAFLPFMVILGTINSESYKSAWVFYTSPADRSRIILASARFALTYFCIPFTVLLLALFTWFFGIFIHALLHCVFIYAILMIITKLMVMVYPRIPFSQPTKAGQRSLSVFIMALVAMPLMIAPLATVSKAGYGGYAGYAVWLGGALLINYLVHWIFRMTIPKRAAKLEFTAPV